MSLPMTFSFGVTGEVDAGLNVGLNVLKQADMEQEFILNGEYAVSIASLRFSYNLNNPQQDMSFGAGINLGSISTNVAMTMPKHFDPIMRFGLGYNF